MLVEQVLQRVVTQGGASHAREERIGGLTASLAQPVAQHSDHVLAQRRAAPLAALALAADMRAHAKNDVVAAKPGELRRAQPGLYRQHDNGPVAPS
jgi:hypothetical protein